MLEPRILEAVDDVRDEVDLEPGGPEPGLGLLGQLACGQPRLVYRGVQGQEGTQPAGTNNPYFRDITRNAEENEMLRQIFRVVSLFPSCISCYISENRLSSGQCTAWGVVQPWTSNSLFSHKYFFCRHRRDNVFCFCTCVTIFGFTDTMDANSVSNFFKAGSRASKPILADPIVFCNEYNVPSSVITIITKKCHK